MYFLKYINTIASSKVYGSKGRVAPTQAPKR